MPDVNRIGFTKLSNDRIAGDDLQGIPGVKYSRLDPETNTCSDSR